MNDLRTAYRTIVDMTGRPRTAGPHRGGHAARTAIMLLDEYPAIGAAPRTAGGSTVTMTLSVVDVDSWQATDLRAAVRIGTASSMDGAARVATTAS